MTLTNEHLAQLKAKAEDAERRASTVFIHSCDVIALVDEVTRLRTERDKLLMDKAVMTDPVDNISLKEVELLRVAAKAAHGYFFENNVPDQQVIEALHALDALKL